MLLFQVVLVSITQWHLDIEQVIIPASLSEQGFIVGRMSPLTAFLFIFLSISTMLSFPARDASGRYNLVAQNTAVVVFTLAIILVIGYWYSAPLLYGGTVTPVALPTAVGFILLSLGLLFDGKNSFFYRWLTSTSVFSLFTRSILPGTIAIIVFAGWFHLSIMKQLPPVYQVLSFSLFALFTAGFITLLTVVVARKVQTAVTQSQHALHESEERFRTIIETAEAGYFFIDRDGKFQHVNNAWLRMHGYASPDEVIGRQFTVSQVKADLQTAQEKVDRLLKGKPISSGVFTRRCKDGSIGYNIFSATPVFKGNEVFGLEGFLIDITERLKQEGELKESEKKYRAILDNIEDGYYEVDIAGNLSFFNKSFSRILSYPAFELMGMNNRVFMDKENAKKVYQAFNRVFTTGEPFKAFDWELIKKDGTKCCIDSSVSLIRDVEGNVTGFRGIIRDISGRKKSDQDLKQSEQRLRTILQTTLNGFWLIDMQGRFIDVNDAYCTMSGYTRDELLELSIPDIEALENEHEVASHMQRIIQQGWDRFETRHRRKDGEFIDVEMNVKYLDFDGGLCVCFCHDITSRKQMERERQKLESQLRQAQKMEAVGRLAGGVAHDFNNMLSVILGYCEISISKLHPADPLYPDIQEIHGAAQRSAELTRQLLAFSRKQIIAPKIIELNTQMKGMERLLKRIIGEDIDLKFNLSQDLWPLFLDPSQVDQAVANLAVNSRDAMPDGGMLTVETCNVAFDEAYCQAHSGFLPGDYVLLAVSDSGYGMDKETLEHVFEPFFTTKSDGKGTGLGLATVYGIVKQNNGFINIYSEPGQGTAVRLYFPRYHGEIQVQSIASHKAALVRGHGTILLVEDQDQLRRLAKTMLERLGYTVLEAASPGEAFVVCEKYTGDIHLLLTDVVMPAMNGKELSERIQILKPGIKILFMSGYTANAIAHRGMLDEGLHFLQKPFSINALSEKVREAMNS